MRPQRLADNLRKLTERVRMVEEGRAVLPGGQVQDGAGRWGVPTGWPAVDAALPGGGLSRRVVHEWMGHDCGFQIAGFGFEKTHTPRVDPQSAIRNPQFPLSLLTHAAWQATAPLDAAPPTWAVWIGRDCWPYPHALVRQGREGRRLLMRSIWVDAPSAGTRLWAIDQALACPAIGAVVADGSRFDMPATRRLQLSARRGGALLLLARPPTDRGELSAAGTRWQVSPEPSPSDQPRWRVRLMRCKGVLPGGGMSSEGTGPASALHGDERTWVVERSHAQGDLRLAADVADRSVATPIESARAAG